MQWGVCGEKCVQLLFYAGWQPLILNSNFAQTLSTFILCSDIVHEQPHHQKTDSPSYLPFCAARTALKTRGLAIWEGGKEGKTSGYPLSAKYQGEVKDGVAFLLESLMECYSLLRLWLTLMRLSLDKFCLLTQANTGRNQ